MVRPSLLTRVSRARDRAGPTDHHAARPVGLWIDQRGAKRRIARLPDREVRTHLDALRLDGVTFLSGHIAPEVCDRIISDFEHYCAEYPAQSAAALLPNGFHSRFYHLHTISEAARQAALDPFVLRILDALFSAPTALNSTHYFEQGSEQAIHRDTPYFYAEPMPGQFVGMWLALEDIEAGTGELTYIRKGHRISVEPAPEGAGDFGSRMSAYDDSVVRECERAGLSVEAHLPRKGDVVIWHPELPHGGSPITKPGASRRSLVAHHIPEGAHVQTAAYFFGLEDPRLDMQLVDAGEGRRMRAVAGPQFMPNY